MRILSLCRVRFLLIALVWLAGCALDNKGLAPTTRDGVAGETTGTGGAMGTGGSIGTGGAVATGGAPGMGGVGGDGGVIGSGSGSSVGMGGAAASGGTGTGGVVGTGGRLGTGGSGAGGRGGASVMCGPSTCQNGCCNGNTCVTNRTNTLCGPAGASCMACAPCFQCSGNGTTCVLNPTSRWTINCVSATITPQKPGSLNSFWDAAGVGFPTTATAPDPFCQFQLDQVGQADTSVLTDTLSPMWNQSITPTNVDITPNFLISEHGNWSVFVGDDDGGPQRFDNVCTVFPTLTADNFTTGIVKFSNIQSCTALTIQLMCASN